MSKTRITVIRHGETEWNKKLQMQGHKDSPLTLNGITQAKLLADTIHHRKFDCLITSDLGRARKSSEIINKHMCLKVLEDSSLRERSFGAMEGLKREEAQERYPELWQAYIARDKDYAIPFGESLVQFNSRVINGIRNLGDKYKGKHILIVAHGGILDCIIRKIFNIELDVERCFVIPNTSVNTFVIEADKWLLEEWGNVAHLKITNALDELN